jgi:Co/Zn/Cd efflux system component
MATKISERPNGPVAAALLAGGIGSAVMGIATLANEVAPKSAFSVSLVWSKAVGGLSGKAGLSIIAYFVAWAILYFLLKDKETKFEQMAMLALAGLVIGLIGTFPPVWHLLAGG